MVGPSLGSRWQCYTIIYTCLEPMYCKTVDAVSSSGVVVISALENIDLGLTVTEINKYRNT